MSDKSYLQWLVQETKTTWWHDSGDPAELDHALVHGASGVTTNPLLSYRAWAAKPDYFRALLGALPAGIAPTGMTPEEKADLLMQVVVQDAARKLESIYNRWDGAQGYACAQVNPARAGDREAMLNMAHLHHAWAPNIAVKLPVTLAGLDVLEECVAEGITVTATVSFTVPQVLAIAERHRLGAERARKAGIRPGHCFAVIMIGRLDDYLTEVAKDNRAPVSAADIQQAGLAVTKRAYAMYKERGYEAVLLVAALRGNYHMTELAGAELIMSIHPRNQGQLMQPGVPREQRIDRPVPQEVIDRLVAMPEFVRAYEPDGMKPEEFVSFGLTQRTLSQFSEAGWMLLESFKL
jgi:transaldolase